MTFIQPKGYPALFNAVLLLLFKVHDSIAVKYAPDFDLQLNRSLIACHIVSELIIAKIVFGADWRMGRIIKLSETECK